MKGWQWRGCQGFAKKILPELGDGTSPCLTLKEAKCGDFFANPSGPDLDIHQVRGARACQTIFAAFFLFGV